MAVTGAATWPKMGVNMHINHLVGTVDCPTQFNIDADFKIIAIGI